MNREATPKVELSLSVEELALMFSLLGQAPLAKTMLNDELGELNEDELRGRIRAASNTLLARGLILPGGDEPVLAPDVAALLGPMASADYALQSTVFGADQPGRNLMLYVQGDRIVSHRLHQGAYHTLQLLDPSEAMAVCEAFYGFAPLAGVTSPPFSLDRAEVQEARLLDDGSAVATQERLERLGVDSETAARFAEDLYHQQAWAIMLRLQTTSDQSIVAELGYQILTGASGRIWLMTVDGEAGATALSVCPADQHKIKDLTRLLVAPE
jgi:hypothetical protein